MQLQAPTFSKRERMVSTKLIDTLFSTSPRTPGAGLSGGAPASSRSLVAFPLRAVFMQSERQADEAAVQVLISVPKKRFKHAVDRNRVKRQVREAYRHQKQLLTDVVPAGRRVLVGFVWIAGEHFSSDVVANRVATLLRKMGERL